MTNPFTIQNWLETYTKPFAVNPLGRALDLLESLPASQRQEFRQGIAQAMLKALAMPADNEEAEFPDFADVVQAKQKVCIDTLNQVLAWLDLLDQGMAVMELRQAWEVSKVLLDDRYQRYADWNPFRKFHESQVTGWNYRKYVDIQRGDC